MQSRISLRRRADDIRPYMPLGFRPSFVVDKKMIRRSLRIIFYFLLYFVGIGKPVCDGGEKIFGIGGGLNVICAVLCKQFVRILRYSPCLTDAFFYLVASQKITSRVFLTNREILYYDCKASNLAAPLVQRYL